MKKSLSDFEAAHGQPRIKKLQQDLEAEQVKVAALSATQNVVSVVRSEKDRLRFGLLGDTHVGSLYQHEGALRGFFGLLERECVRQCFVTGDVLDGHRIYKGQEFELRDVGLDAQVARLAGLKLPRSVEVSFITGNHDASFKQLAGAPVGRLISQARPGWKFLGEDQARVQFKTPAGNYELMLLHPGGGTSYALSYRAQKIAESLEGGQKPNLLAIGHYHKAEFMPSYRNISVIQTGTFQRQTPFMARGGLAAHVGGWLVEVVVGRKTNMVKAEFVAFY